MLIQYTLDNYGGFMKKVLIAIVITLFCTAASIAAEITDNNITHSPEYYRQQIIVVQKYSKSNFIKAVCDGDVHITEAYIKSGMNPDSTQMKLPAVMFAVSADKPESVTTLLKNGANPDITTLGITPLMFAVNKKSLACTKALIDNNANVNTAYKGVTPLYTAISKKQYEIAELLINAGAEISDEIIVKAVNSGNEQLKNLVLQSAVKSLKYNL